MGDVVSEKGFELDMKRVRQSFSRAAETYDDAAFLQKEVADRMLERLDYIRINPGRVLDLGAGTGYCSEKLLGRYRADVVALDFAEGMLQQARRRGKMFRRPRSVCASAGRLPLADGSFDMLVSSLMLQWCHPVDEYFQEFRRVLTPGGMLMFTTFGPDTLTELRQAWGAVDRRVHVHGFLDMHDLGDALLRQGFSSPVMDVERIVLTYADVRSLLRELKAIGANNAEQGRPRGLTGRDSLRRFEQAYEAFRSGEGALPATYEVVYGHAWAPGEVGAGAASYHSHPIIPVVPMDFEPK